MGRVEEAINYKHNGYNCCQAVLMAYKDLIPLSEEQIKNIGSGFAVGMGGMEGDCGAMIGANMVLGFCNDTGMPTAPFSKRLVGEFRAHAGAICCRELKGAGTGKVLCPCDDCIKIAVMILQGFDIGKD